MRLQHRYCERFLTVCIQFVHHHSDGGRLVGCLVGILVVACITKDTNQVSWRQSVYSCAHAVDLVGGIRPMELVVAVVLLAAAAAVRRNRRIGD